MLTEYYFAKCMLCIMQAASFNYDMLYKVARAISDEVRAKVKGLNVTQTTRQCHNNNYYTDNCLTSYNLLDSTTTSQLMESTVSLVSVAGVPT